MRNFYKHIVTFIVYFIMSAGINFAQTTQNNSLNSLQNYPNPFNLQTQIQFVLSQEADVTVKVFNILGKEINTIIENQIMSAGLHSTEWNGKDKNGHVVPSGIYLYQVQAGNSVITKKMSLLK